MALILRELLSPLKLDSCVKTSGQKGLHVYVPLNRKETTFADTKRFSKAVAEVLRAQLSGSGDGEDGEGGAEEEGLHQLVAERRLEDDGLRLFPAGPGESRSFPFPLPGRNWRSLARQGDPEKLQVLHSEAVSRAEKEGDLFREVLVKKQKLPYL